ncbi:tRNA-modifying protein YgfZ [Lacimicrobium sp. SS2-24]|uniref:tRNA-modifying protein YgfZ n=1 Tax=Lacimicrobium sp. SS2-24 TaxID=2005569 RepID=UPI000B4A5A91|nr:tRNA-modifying protein YgfZ [Lacimicrobium sp. SS2-24]
MTANNLPNTAADAPDEFLVPLTDRAVLQLSGADTHKYLQGQLTQDMNLLTDEHAVLGCHCEFKGKTWDIYTVAQTDSDFLLIGHEGAIEKSLEQLQKYAVFSQVEISRSKVYRLLGGRGQFLENWIDNHFSRVPENHLDSAHSDAGLVIRYDYPHVRYMLILTKEAADNLINIAPNFTVTSLWKLMDIRAGIPSLNAETSGEYVPQMLNMQALNGISFSKGCYMGQEVVARTKFLGKNKRATFILKADSNATMAPGSLLEKQVGEHWRRGGTVLSVVTLAKETWLLAVLSNDTQADEVLRSKDAPEILFKVQPLPYTLEPESDKSALQ